MFKRLLCAIFVFKSIISVCQLSVPLDALPNKVILVSNSVGKKDTSLYAKIFTDTMKNVRLSVFYDTAKGTVKSVLFEIFNEKRIIERQVFLSMYYYPRTWEEIEFLDPLVKQEIDQRFLTKVKSDIKMYFGDIFSTIYHLFSKKSQVVLRESNIVPFDGWVGAVQICPSSLDKYPLQWLTLEIDRNKFAADTNIIGENLIIIGPRWWIGYKSHVSYSLIRFIKDNRLIFMERNDAPSNYFRRFNYNKQNQLYQIFEGEFFNETEEVKNVITVIY